MEDPYERANRFADEAFAATGRGTTAPEDLEAAMNQTVTHGDLRFDPEFEAEMALRHAYLDAVANGAGMIDIEARHLGILLADYAILGAQVGEYEVFKKRAYSTLSDNERFRGDRALMFQLLVDIEAALVLRSNFGPGDTFEKFWEDNVGAINAIQQFLWERQDADPRDEAPGNWPSDGWTFDTATGKWIEGG